MCVGIQLIFAIDLNAQRKLKGTIPGPSVMPIVGTTHHLFKYKDNPLPFFTDMQKKVYAVWETLIMWVVTIYNDCVPVLQYGSHVMFVGIGWNPRKAIFSFDPETVKHFLQTNFK